MLNLERVKTGNVNFIPIGNQPRHMESEMKLTPEQYEEIMRRPAIKRANSGDCGQTQGAEPQCPVLNGAMGQDGGEDRDSASISVRIVSFRKRLIDPDNLCPKYFIDCLRYSQLIPDDRAQDINLQVQQQKVKSKAEERTEITITFTETGKDQP